MYIIVLTKVYQNNNLYILLQCFNGVSSNPVKGRTKICQLKDLTLTLLG